MKMTFKGRIKVMSVIAPHSPLNISETVRDRGMVLEDHQQEWPTRKQMITWPMTSREPERSNWWRQYVYSAISRKQLSWRCYL